MASRDYFFDFYECLTSNSQPGAVLRNTADILSQMCDAKDAGEVVVREIARRSYELRQIEETDFGYRGIIGKHRENDLPHAATINGDEREIELAPNENLLEKAFFHFYSDYQLLILQRNYYCISSNNLGKFFSSSGYVTTLNPVIEPTDLQWLMRNNIQVRNANISIARPRNPELFEGIEHDFNNSIISTLRGTGAAKINLSLRGDGRSLTPEERYLDSGFKRAIREMQATFEVKKCELLLEDQDNFVTHPVDLVADRLFYKSTIDVEGRYPPNFEVWAALNEARSEKQQELINYFGEIGSDRLE